MLPANKGAAPMARLNDSRHGPVVQSALKDQHPAVAFIGNEQLGAFCVDACWTVKGSRGRVGIHDAVLVVVVLGIVDKVALADYDVGRRAVAGRELVVDQHPVVE